MSIRNKKSLVVSFAMETTGSSSSQYLSLPYTLASKQNKQVSPFFSLYHYCVLTDGFEAGFHVFMDDALARKVAVKSLLLE